MLHCSVCVSEGEEETERVDWDGEKKVYDPVNRGREYADTTVGAIEHVSVCTVR